MVHKINFMHALGVGWIALIELLVNIYCLVFASLE